MSAIESEPPGWPHPALYTDSIILIRKLFAIRDNSISFVLSIKHPYKVSLKYSTDKDTYSYIHKVYDANASKSHFVIPSNLKDNITFDFNLKNLYDVSYDLQIIYSDTEKAPKLIIANDYIHGNVTPIFEGVKEVYVYTDNPRKLVKSITKLGYDVCIPSMVEHKDGISMIVLYMLSIVIVVALLIMFFISFAIIQRIYLTKTKDYSIFRTLGLVSNDLKKMLVMEVIVTTLISIVAGAILSNLTIIISKTDLYKYVSGWLLIIYTLTMIVFGLLTAIRLNNKIFKNSVYQSIKEGSE